MGSFIATLLLAVFADLQHHSFSYFLWTFFSVQLAQTIVANVIEPRIVGRSLNLSPLVVFVTLTVWGVLGMIITVPVTSILVIILAQFPNTRYVAVLLSESGDISNMIVPVKKKKA